MGEKKMPHAFHEEHLCYLENLGFLESNLDKYKVLVRSANYVCRKCGRAAANEKNLCKADKL